MSFEYDQKVRRERPQKLEQVHLKISRELEQLLKNDEKVISEENERQPHLKPPPTFKVDVENPTPLTLEEFNNFMNQLYNYLRSVFNVEPPTP